MPREDGEVWSQPASIVIGELKPLPTQLASKNPIFLDQIRDRLVLLAIQPASQDGQHYLESGRVDHGLSLCHQAKSLLRLHRPGGGTLRVGPEP